MDDQPGLFDLPEPERPASPARTARGRARERFARRVVVDAVVVDAAALRAGALHTLDHTITISEGGAGAAVMASVKAATSPQRSGVRRGSA